MFSVKDELRNKILEILRNGGELFPEIKGQHEAKEKVAAALVSKRDIFFLGKRGCGKTEFAKSIAKMLGEIKVVKGCVTHDKLDGELCPLCLERRDGGEELETITISGIERFRYIYAHGEMRISEIIGYADPLKGAKKGYSVIDPKTFAPGGLLQANRGIIFIDDLTNMPLQKQIAFNNALDSGEIATGQYPIKFPINVLFIGAANPYEYYSANKIAEPLRDRVEIVEMGYPETLEIEREIMEERSFGERGLYTPLWLKNFIVHTIRLARENNEIDQRDGVSVRATIHSYEHTSSYAELSGRKVPSLGDVYKGIRLGLAGRIHLRSGRPKEEVIDELMYSGEHNALLRSFCEIYRDKGEESIRNMIGKLEEASNEESPNLASYRDFYSEFSQVPTSFVKEYATRTLEFLREGLRQLDKRRCEAA